jgi:hypothetical protein
MIRPFFSLRTQIANAKPVYSRRQVCTRVSNYDIGYKGESMLTTTISNVCRNWEIKDMSTFAAESDIHIVNMKGNIIAFECKNKKMIKYDDVQKSCRDIAFLKDKYGDKFIGYMFVSLRSVNIPHREFFHLMHGIPTIWYGQLGDESKALERVIELVIHLATDMSISATTIDELPLKINNISNVIAINRSQISAMNKQICSMFKSIKAMEDNNELLFNMLEDITNV